MFFILLFKIIREFQWLISAERLSREMFDNNVSTKPVFI